MVPRKYYNDFVLITYYWIVKRNYNFRTPNTKIVKADVLLNGEVVDPGSY